MEWEKLVRELKYSRGVTETQIADETGVSIRTVQGWLAGRDPGGSAQKHLRRLYDDRRRSKTIHD